MKVSETVLRSISQPAVRSTRRRLGSWCCSRSARRIISGSVIISSLRQSVGSVSSPALPASSAMPIAMFAPSGATEKVVRRFARMIVIWVLFGRPMNGKRLVSIYLISGIIPFTKGIATSSMRW